MRIRHRVLLPTVLLLFSHLGLVAQKPELVVQTGHSSSISEVAFSPNGKLLASGSNDNTVKLWDVATGRELRTFTGHSKGVGAVAFSPDGRLLASGSDDKTVRLWDAATGRELRNLTGHSKSITSVAFSPDGKTLVSASGFNSGNSAPDPMRLWDVATGRELRSLQSSERTQVVNAVAFSADGSMIASASDSGVIQLWQPTTGLELRTLRGHSAPVLSVAFSKDGKRLASGSDDKTTRIWDLLTGNELRSFTGHTEGVATVALSPDAKTVASGSGNILDGNSTIKLWDVVTGRELHTLVGQSGEVTSVAFSPDGKTLAGSTGNIMGPSVINLWDVATWRQLHTLAGNSGWVTAIAFSFDHKTMASSSYDKTISLWNMTTGQKTFTLSGHSSWVHSVAFSPDGKMVASGGGDKVVKLWQVATGSELATLSGHTGPINAVVFSNDGKLLASGSYDDSIRLWDVAGRKEIKTVLGHSSMVTSVLFSRDDTLLASGSEDGTVKLWNVASGTELRTFAGHSSGVSSLALSPEGKTLASGSNDNTAKLWDLSTGRELHTLNGHSNIVSSVAFSADGKTLMTGSWDKTVKLWDVATGRELRTLTGHSDVVSAVIFTGNFLVTGGADATMKLWRQDSTKLLATLISLDEGDWAVVTPDNRFDTNRNLDNIEGLHWVMPDAPFTPLPLEIFMRDYYEPHLLARLMKCSEENNCDREFKPVRDIAKLNRVQPPVTITSVSVPDANGYVNVTVQVEKGEGRFLREGKEISISSDVYDLRLFRDGQMVAYWPQEGADNLLEQTQRDLGAEPPVSDDAGLLKEESDWQRATRVSLDQNNKKTLTARIRLPRGKDAAKIELTAYAFNESRVKSQTARWSWTNVKSQLPSAQTVKSRAYVISVGVNASENPKWSLQYAVNDALKIRDALSDKLKQLRQADGLSNRYEVVALALVSDYNQNGALKSNDATKPKIQAVFDLLAGRTINSELMAALTSSVPQASQLRKAEPDDLVLISFSSHGYTDRNGNFFILPYDIGTSTKITADLLLRAISSDELSLWLRDVDAGDMVMIIDACHAAAVAGRDFKPGPMASRGLGQLAYYKRMSVLTATQANDFALESGSLGQGLLSYALVEDGLRQGHADFKPVPDGSITMKEWLEYGEVEVPVLYDKIKSRDLKAIGQGAKAVIVTGQEQETYQQQPSLFDFARQRDFVISIIGRRE